MNKIIIYVLLLLVCLNLNSQQIKQFDLDEVISIALDQSPDAILAKHIFKGNYWEYRTYKAAYKPSLNLNATLPDINRSISRITIADGSDIFIKRQLANSSLNMNLNQNITLTGGKFFINSDLQRIDLLGDSVATSYMSTPISIGFMQPIFGFNSYRWEKKIEPLKYEEAKKKYLVAREEITIKAINYFFDLILAQINSSISEVNHSNNDTLFKMAQGRFNIGTIAQNELLQMELNFLKSESSLNETKLDLELKKFRLRSFLGYNDNVDFNLIIPEKINNIQIEIDKAIELARKNSPQMLEFDRQIIESDRDIARARSENMFNANLFASYGLTQSAIDVPSSYKNPQDQQRVSVGIQIPIIDWGQGRGRYKMAQSAGEVIKTRVQQSIIDFDQDIYIKVMQFNTQNNNVRIAAKADTVAQMRYDITKQRFYIGKINVTDLTIALSEKDGAKRSYIYELRNYFNYYYTLRKLTLYDFKTNSNLDYDFITLYD